MAAISRTVIPRASGSFLTWQLHGSLPPAPYPPPYKTSDGKTPVWMDRYLDTTRLGPM